MGRARALAEAVGRSRSAAGIRTRQNKVRRFMVLSTRSSKTSILATGHGKSPPDGPPNAQRLAFRDEPLGADEPHLRVGRRNAYPGPGERHLLPHPYLDHLTELARSRKLDLSPETDLAVAEYARARTKLVTRFTEAGGTSCPYSIFTRTWPSSTFTSTSGT